MHLGMKWQRLAMAVGGLEDAGDAGDAGDARQLCIVVRDGVVWQLDTN